MYYPCCNLRGIFQDSGYFTLFHTTCGFNKETFLFENVLVSFTLWFFSLGNGNSVSPINPHKTSSLSLLSHLFLFLPLKLHIQGSLICLPTYFFYTCVLGSQMDFIFIFKFTYIFLFYLSLISPVPSSTSPTTPCNHHTVVPVHQFSLSLSFLALSLQPRNTSQELSTCYLWVWLYFAC